MEIKNSKGWEFIYVDPYGDTWCYTDEYKFKHHIYRFEMTDEEFLELSHDDRMAHSEFISDDEMKEKFRKYKEENSGTEKPSLLKVITEEQAKEIKEYLTYDVFNHIRDNITGPVPKFSRYEAFKDLAILFTEQVAILEMKANNQTRRLSDIRKDIMGK
jgi:hypothetical protein